MALSPSQLVTLKAHIDASSDLNEFPNNADGNFEVAKLLNLPASPDYWVWRTLVTKVEYTQSTSQDGTTFNWTGSGFIGRSQGERDAWRELFNGTESCNPSLLNVRQAFLDIFSGVMAPAPANRAHLASVSRRRCTRAEKLYAIDTPNSGANRGTTGDPDTLVFEGNVSVSDVDAARNLP